MYAKIEKGKIKETRPRPDWFMEDGSPVTDEYLNEYENMLPLIENPPKIDPVRQQVKTKPLSEWIVETNQVRCTYTIKNRPLQDIKQDRIKEIETIRKQNLKTMEYTLPSGEKAVVNIAEDSPDKPRQSWFATTINKAIIAVMRNEEFSEVLIDSTDTEHVLTAQEWLDFGEALHKKTVRALKNANKDRKAIMNFTDADSVISYSLATCQE